jgi:hypothetical protein
MARHFLSPCIDPLASFFVALALVYNDEGETWGRAEEGPNPVGVEYETTFRAERDNSLRKTWGRGRAGQGPNPKGVEVSKMLKPTSLFTFKQRGTLLTLGLLPKKLFL